MAHAGTMVVGSAQSKQSGNPWPAIALALAVIVATVAGVWLASSAGLVGGTAKPAADQSYDAYLNRVAERTRSQRCLPGSNAYLEFGGGRVTRTGGPERSVDSRSLPGERAYVTRLAPDGARTACLRIRVGARGRVDWRGCSGGIAVERSVGTAWIGAGFVLLGLLANVLAILRFARARRALRMGAPLPTDVFPIAFATALTMLGATLAIYVIARIA